MKKSELKEIIKSAMLAEIETVEEGVWSVLPARIPEFIDAIDDIKEKYHSVVGSDDVFNGLDQAISAAEELLMNTAEIYEAKEDEEAEEIDIDTDTETADAGEIDMEIGDDEGLKGPSKKIDDSLEAAIEAARELGDQKLIDQIGNTITFFTRTHVVGKGEVEEGVLNENKEEARYELEEIMDQLYRLSDQAKMIFRNHFPTEYTRLEAYGALDFGTSSNRYDVTLEGTLENLDMEDDDEDMMNEGVSKELSDAIDSWTDDERVRKAAKEYAQYSFNIRQGANPKNLTDPLKDLDNETYHKVLDAYRDAKNIDEAVTNIKVGDLVAHDKTGERFKVISVPSKTKIIGKNRKGEEKTLSKHHVTMIEVGMELQESINRMQKLAGLIK